MDVLEYKLAYNTAAEISEDIQQQNSGRSYCSDAQLQLIKHVCSMPS